MTKHLGIKIARPLDQVYSFLMQPANFPKWATGLVGSLHALGDGNWRIETPAGPMKVRFSEVNSLGILDHWLETEDGDTIYVPIRVIANQGASEALLTLFQRSGMADDEFARDAEWVMRDLRGLKELLER